MYHWYILALDEIIPCVSYFKDCNQWWSQSVLCPSEWCLKKAAPCVWPLWNLTCRLVVMTYELSTVTYHWAGLKYSYKPHSEHGYTIRLEPKVHWQSQVKTLIKDMFPNGFLLVAVFSVVKLMCLIDLTSRWQHWPFPQQEITLLRTCSDVSESEWCLFVKWELL